MAIQGKSDRAFQSPKSTSTFAGTTRYGVLVFLSILLVLVVPPTLWTLARTGHLHTSATISQNDLKWEDGIWRTTKRAFTPPLNDLDERYATVLSDGRSLARKGSIGELHLPEVRGAFWMRGAFVRIKPFAPAMPDGPVDERYILKRPVRIGTVAITAWLAVSLALVAALRKSGLLQVFFRDCRSVWAWVVSLPFREAISKGSPFIYATIATTSLSLEQVDKLSSPYLVAEDGPVFVQQNLVFGAGSIMTPYGGYLLVGPRLIAYFCGFASIGDQARLYVLGCVLVMWVVFLLIATFAANWYESIAVAAFLMVAPLNGYMMFSLTNLQWFTGLVLVMLAVKPLPRQASGWTKGFVAMFALLAALTGPFSIITLPVFVLQAWRHRSRFATFMASLQGLAALAQLKCLFDFYRLVYGTSKVSERTDPAEWIAGFTFGLFGHLPAELSTGSLIAGLALTGALALAIAASWRTWEGSREGRVRLVLLLGLAVLFAAAGWMRSRGVGVPWRNGERYYVIPYAMAVIAITSMMFARLRVVRVAAGGILATLLIGLWRLPVHAIPSVDWELAVSRIPPAGNALIASFPPEENWSVFVAKNDAGDVLRGDDYATELEKQRPGAIRAWLPTAKGSSP